MSKTKKLSKVLALVIMLTLLVGILPMGAMATNVDRTSRTFYNDNNTAVSTVTVSGTGVVVAGISDWTKSSDTEATFVVALSPNCSLTSVLVTIDPSNTQLSSGSATLAVDQETDNTILAGGITYTVFVQKEAAYQAAATGRNAYISEVAGENATLSYNTTATIDGHTTYLYNASAPASSYPYPFSLRIIPGGTSYDETPYTFSVTSASDVATLKNFAGTYFLATFCGNNVNLDFSITTNTNTTVYYRITFVSTGSAGGSANGVEAYLPAPGQYTNEGIGTGGWGSIFPSGSTTVPKAMVNAIASTGVSLGSFGGYVVFDMGVDATGKDKVKNTATNPYGVDFIIYGNAFKDNSEPGCVEVYGTVDGEHYAWYTLAGNLHYNSNTKWNVEVTYTNPTPADDMDNSTSSTLASVNYIVKQNNVQIGSGTITKNNFHNHSWYPLHRNYFANDMDKLSTLGFGTHVRDGSTGEGTVMFKGTLLYLDGYAKKTATANYTFGYADVHPNGTNYGTAVNPYAATADTTGGDGFDLAWAVNANGEPVKLLSARKVRVYTGTTAMNGAFGEISAEVCGIYQVTGVGNGANNATIELWKDYAYTPTPMNANAVTEVAADTYYLVSNDSYVYVNGVRVTDANTTTGHQIVIAAGQFVQIISQSGTRSPFITVLKGV